MTHQFDLEQQILDCWRVTGDLNALVTAVMEQNLSKDEIVNVLIGLKALYDIKFDQTFRTFEAHLSDYYQARRTSEAAYEPVVESTTAD